MTSLSLSCSRTCWSVAPEDHQGTTSDSNEQDGKSRLCMSYVDSLVLIDNSIHQPQIDHGDFAWWGGSKILLIAPTQECGAVTHCRHYLVWYQLFESASVIKKDYAPLNCKSTKSTFVFLLSCNTFDVNDDEASMFTWMQIMLASTRNEMTYRFKHILHKSIRQKKKKQTDLTTFECKFAMSLVRTQATTTTAYYNSECGF